MPLLGEAGQDVAAKLERRSMPGQRSRDQRLETRVAGVGDLLLVDPLRDVAQDVEAQKVSVRYTAGGHL